MNSVNKKKLIGQLSIYRPALILLVTYVLAIILSSDFLSMANLSNVLGWIIMAGIVERGMTFAILTRGIGLPVGSALGLAGVLTSGILESTGDAGTAILVVLAVGIGCGAVDDFFVTMREIPPLISTLDITIFLHGCVFVYTEGSPVPTKMDAYGFLGKGTVAGVSAPIIIFIILFLIAHYVLTQTSYSHNIYAFGGDREAVRLPGTSIRFTEQMAYILNGLMCGAAGVILTARLGLAQPTSDIGIEMDAVVAIIPGGTSLSGGADPMFPIVVGAMIIGIIDNILTFMNVNSHATNIIKGIVILVAILVDEKVKGLSAKVE